MGKLQRATYVAFCALLLPVLAVEVSQRVRADLSVPAPVSPLPMPFLRTGDPSIIPATTTPQQYIISQPDGTVTYRAYNPCVSADVRIKTVAPLEPITTVDTKYPGVKQVTSKTDVVSTYTGTRYGRGPETMGSTANPISGGSRVVSIMLVPIPGYPAQVDQMTCEFELQYGRSG